MSGKEELVTAEFYGDSLLLRLLGAVDLPKKRMIEYTETLGKTICKLRKMNLVEAVLIDSVGETIDRMTVYR